MLPGLRLRQTRERLGLTYRDVERASYELASRRGRPEFILHISRLADIENRGVVPGLHKLYTLAAVYRLNPLEMHFYGYIGMSDRRMMPLLRPGSIVLVDGSVRKIDDGDWMTEHDRPMYFVEVRGGYRCGWFHQEGSRLVMQPHPLSHCLPETWRVPEEAEIVGRVTGVVTRLSGPENVPHRGFPAEPGDSSRKAP